MPIHFSIGFVVESPKSYGSVCLEYCEESEIDLVYCVEEEIDFVYDRSEGCN